MPDISRSGWTAYDSNHRGDAPASGLLDSDTNTLWLTDNFVGGPPFDIWFDMGAPQLINYIKYKPWYDRRPKNVDLYLSDDGVAWGLPVTFGVWPTAADQNNQILSFPAQTKRWFKLRIYDSDNSIISPPIYTQCGGAEINAGYSSTPLIGTLGLRVGTPGPPGIRVVGQPYYVTNKNLPDGQIGIAYSFQTLLTGGVAPYTFNISTGSLPTGLSINNTGLISGVPTVGGFFSPTIRVTDNVGTQSFASVSIYIFKPGNPVISTSLITLDAIIIAAHSSSVYAGVVTSFLGTDISDPLLSYLGSGDGAAGLGVIFFDRPDFIQNYSKTKFYDFFDLTRISSSSGIKLSPALNVSLCVLTITIEGSLFGDGLNTFDVYGFYFRATFSDGTRQYSYPTVAQVFTDGRNGTVTNKDLSVDSGPGAFDTFAHMERSHFTSLGYSVALRLRGFGSFQVLQPDALPFTLDCNSLPNGQIRSAYSHNILIQNGFAPYIISISAGALPDGLTIDNTGLISGITGNTSGIYTFTIHVVDFVGQITEVTCSINIQSCKDSVVPVVSSVWD